MFPLHFSLFLKDPSTFAIACDFDPNIVEDRLQVRRTLRHGGQTLSSAHHNQVRSQYSALSPEQQEQAAQTMYLRRHQVRAEDTTPLTEGLAVPMMANDLAMPVQVASGAQNSLDEVCLAFYT